MGKSFLNALAGKVSDVPPFWFMRQAGRYLPEYRELRAEKGGFLEMAFDPVSAAEITMQPLRRFDMDAAIIFSDILTIPMALGQHLEFVHGEGPKLGALDISSLDYDDQVLDPVYEALLMTKRSMVDEGFKDTALIGFAGAPWTVATYMVEGGSSKDFMKTKVMSYEEPEKFQILIDHLVNTTADYLIKQIDAGAEAVQIFDSWAGALDPISFQKYSIEPTRRIVDLIHVEHPDIPIIGFPKGAGYNYKSYASETGITALGIDQHVPTKWAAAELQNLMPVQGNLDPFVVMAGGDAMARAVDEIKSNLGGGAYVFNLGHGIHKDTRPEHVEELVKMIREG